MARPASRFVLPAHLANRPDEATTLDEITTRSGHTLLRCPETGRLAIREDSTGEIEYLPHSTTEEAALETLDVVSNPAGGRFRGRKR